MLTIRIGLGTSKRIGTVKLYHVLNEDGLTLRTCTSEQEAQDWIKAYYVRNPIKHHNKKG